MSELTAQQAMDLEADKKTRNALRGLGAAAQAVGLEDHRRLLADTAKRVRESHKAMATAAGMGDALEDSGEDEMGDILITGDISMSEAAKQQSPKQGDSLLSKAAKAAGIVALTGLGVGGGAVAYSTLAGGEDAPAPVVEPETKVVVEPAESPDTDTKYSLGVSAE